MKKLLFVLALLVGFGSTSFAQVNKQLEKAKEKQTKEKLKELKKDGWKIDASINTLEVAYLEFYEKLNSKDYKAIVGTTSNCISTNVCRQVCFNNACIDYAGKANSSVEGKVNSLNTANSSEGTAEVDKTISAYTRYVQASIKGVLTEGFALVRKTGDVKEYRIFYLVNEKEAEEVRTRAMQKAIRETKLATDDARKIEEFVKEGFPTENQ